MKPHLRSTLAGRGASPLPQYVQSLLTQADAVLSVVGLNEADLLFAHNAMYAFCTGDLGTPPSKIAEVLRPIFLFRHASIAENIFLRQRHPFLRRKTRLARKCAELFKRFGVQISPLLPVSSLNDDEKKIIELLRALMQKPRYLFLNNTLSFLGYSYKNIFSSILNAFKEDGCTVVYLTSKWEDGLSIADNIAIIYRERFLEKYHSSHELRANPQLMVYLLSGLELDLSKNESDALSLNVLSSINSSSKLFINNYEIDQSIQHLLRSIREALRSNGCIIYIRDEHDCIQAISDDPESSSPYMLKEAYVRYLVQNESTPQHFQISAPKRTDYFKFSNNDAYYMILMPIQVSAKTQGFLQLAYHKQIVFSKAQMLALDAFCSEVSIILETSKLINQSVLMRESHHRIKNNLQIVISLLIAQKRRVMNEEVRPIVSEILDSTIERIHSISIVHDLLSRNKAGNNLIALDDLIHELTQFYEENLSDIRIERDLDHIDVFYNKSTSIAMIVTELISNSTKHAFKNSTQKLVRVSCKLQDSELVLKVSDNGPGFKAGFDINTADTNGMSILRNLIRSMNGRVRAYNQDGATIEIALPLSAISTEAMR